MTMEAYEIETALSFVASGMGITLVPPSFQTHEVPGVVYKELLYQTTTFETSMAWRSDENSLVALAFIGLVRQSLQQIDNENTISNLSDEKYKQGK
ncbi:LysR substrate-binding domain-containing protein [Rummeliibacillus sp. JY-2-4R]